MNPYAILAIVATVGALTGGAYWQGRQDGRNGCEAAAAREERVGVMAAESAASAAAVAISKIEVQHVTIRQKTDTVIREVPVYRDCRHDPGVLRDINAARTGVAEPAGGGKLPPAAATH